ncbi:response regulator transcription factor [Candidatus Entotheonella palauensis]|uniref:response regulator transcription factor n=1 Tax=Candidatus Entotheonella palauensis TaxID=93172 RepID=UPI000B7C84F0|nr:response regulator transcription factor [Candidatus Entotheonella palauensis]
MRILLVEDDPDVAANIADYLDPRDVAVDFAYDGVSGLHWAVTEAYDVIVLDVMLPGIDGYTLCRRLRHDAQLATPILILTARDGLTDKIEGFEAGTDDYLVKPFALPELYHRLLALGRRRSKSPHEGRLRVADLICDPNSGKVERASQTIKLSHLDLKLLIALMRASPSFMSREQLEDQVWGEDSISDDIVRAHIYRLRKAIDRPFALPLVHTVHGLGYAIREPDADASL